MLGFSLYPIVGPGTPLGEWLARYWLVLLVSFIAALALTPLARALAFKFKILDIPDKTVKTHSVPTAYLGGLAVTAAFLIGCAVGVILLYDSECLSQQIKVISAICGGAILACIIGLIDDIKDIKPWQKLIGQALCSVFLFIGNIKPDLTLFFKILGISINPLLCEIVEYIIVLFFVLGASNSLNLIDGLDGLCTGVSAIITFGFLCLALHLATWSTEPSLDPVRIIIGMSLAGACLGFLFFNKHPARIFLGDAGSVFLGFVIASMMILFSTKNPRWWFASIVIFGLPILDTATALIRRALNHRPLLKSDRGHIYDQMIDRGIPLKKTVIINYILAGVFAVIGLIIAIFVRTRYAIFVDIVIFLICFIYLGVNGYYRMEGLRGAVHKSENDNRHDDNQ